LFARTPLAKMSGEQLRALRERALALPLAEALDVTIPKLLGAGSR
jgi:hypothetical protein